MSEFNPGNIDHPDTVIGPITLGLHHRGKPIDLNPNETLNLADLGFDGSGGVKITALAVATGTLTLNVTADSGATTIAVSGLNANAVAVPCPAGTLLTAIARTHGTVMLHVNENGQPATPAFPAAGSVSVLVK